ncbi:MULTISPECIES: hypothetical protein [unclassified Nonomuraea]|uniref:hypothetical protein n=1 Tax=unclassified Nonomuraea TaxID=2593643 RepID=UPI0033F30DF6
MSHITTTPEGGTALPAKPQRPIYLSGFRLPGSKVPPSHLARAGCALLALIALDLLKADCARDRAKAESGAVAVGLAMAAALVLTWPSRSRCRRLEQLRPSDALSRVDLWSLAWHRSGLNQRSPQFYYVP